MDPLTHGMVGALLGASASPREHVRAGAAVGLVASLIPDLDILVRSSVDPLLVLEVHRTFSHSLIAVPIIALVVAALATPLLRGALTFIESLRAAILGALSAGLLDACTSYGTMLLWPFDPTRFALSIIAIVDPAFTLIALVALVLIWLRRTRLPGAWGICLLITYLGLGWFQHERAAYVAATLANDRGHPIERLAVKPTLGNLVLWRTIYQAEGEFHVDAVRLGLLSDVELYPGSSLAALDASPSIVSPSSRQGQDVTRFVHLSDGFCAYDPYDPLVIGDIRYAMLPDSVRPLWGIRLEPSDEQAHVRYETFRRTDEGMLERFWQMLLGSPAGR